MTPPEELKVNFNLKEKNVTISDPVLGTRTIDGTDHVALIQDQLRYLQSIQMKKLMHNQPITDHLKKDIATYRYMLNDADPKARVQEYFLTKGQFKADGKHLSNYEVAEHLGWKIT